MREEDLIRALFLVAIISLLIIIVSNHFVSKNVSKFISEILVPLTLCTKDEQGNYFLANETNTEFCSSLDDVSRFAHLLSLQLPGIDVD